MIKRLNRLKTWLQERLRKMYAWLNNATGGSLEILAIAVSQFSRCNAPESASSLAFFGILSLFPLLAVLVTVLSFFANEGQIQRILLDTLRPIFPASSGLIQENLQRFIELRGTFGLIGIVGLLWSASSVFTILTYNINSAWEKARLRSVLQRRLMAIGFIFALVVFLILLLVLTTIADLLTESEVPILGRLSIYDSPLWPLLTVVIPPLITFLAFFVLYRWIPNTEVRTPEAAWAALVVTLLWQVTSAGFAWYVASGLVYYDILYGSLAAITVLMLWFYINSMILLFGAYLSSAIAQRSQRWVVTIPGKQHTPGDQTVLEQNPPLRNQTKLEG